MNIVLSNQSFSGWLARKKSLSEPGAGVGSVLLGLQVRRHEGVERLHLEHLAPIVHLHRVRVRVVERVVRVLHERLGGQRRQLIVVEQVPVAHRVVLLVEQVRVVLLDHFVRDIGDGPVQLVTGGHVAATVQEERFPAL